MMPAHLKKVDVDRDFERCSPRHSQECIRNHCTHRRAIVFHFIEKGGNLKMRAASGVLVHLSLKSGRNKFLFLFLTFTVI